MIAKGGSADIAGAVALEQTVQVAPWTARNLQDALAQGYYWRVLRHNALDTPIVAHAIAVQVLDEMQLLSIAVAPQHQGRGYARALLMDLAQAARRRACTQIFCEVRVSNLKAQSVYRACGFGPLGVRPRFYAAVVPGGEREDALQMVWSLHQHESGQRGTGCVFSRTAAQKRA